MTRLEKLLTILAGAAIFAVIATDPWFIDNWLRIGLIFLAIVVASTLAFLGGVSHGIKIAAENAEKTLEQALDQQALKLKRDAARRDLVGGKVKL